MQTPDHSWRQAMTAYIHPRVITMLFLGFSAGLPILLIFSSLSLWLREAGVDRSAVTYFSWAALGYSFKFVWAPVVDSLPIPFLSKRLGRRRAWLLVSQLSVISAILWMSCIDPAVDNLTWMAYAAVLLGFSSATQDIVIDAFRIEAADSDLQAMMSSTYIAGYRIGMVLAGAGALYLASYFGTSKELYQYQAWQFSYMAMAAAMLIGVATTLMVKEPELTMPSVSLATNEYARFMMLFLAVVISFIITFRYVAPEIAAIKSILFDTVQNKALASVLSESLRLGLALIAAGFAAKLLMLSGFVKKQLVEQTYIEPVRDFFSRYGLKTALYLLALIGLYRVSDIVLGVISNVFYQDLSFSKDQIATVVKTFGLLMTIVGGFLGGMLSLRFGVIRILMLGAVLSAATNLLFMWLAHIGNDLLWLYLVIGADNLSAGLASAAFVAFLSSLTNISFTAMQYALFSSLMTLFPKILGGYSGSMVNTMGYDTFFMMTACMGLPVIILILFAQKLLDRHGHSSAPTA